MDFELLVKLSPLLVATLHGYGAAWLAVKMLFRPRHAVYVFGWRVPLTPGMLPKERERFIEALSTVIAERLLTVETVADEFMKLGLEGEISTLARREYIEQSQRESTVQLIAEHLRGRLHHLRDSVETRWEIVRAVRQIVEAEMERRFSFVRHLVAGYFLDDETLYRIVGDSISKLADQVVDSLYARTTIAEAMAQIPEKVFQSGGAPPGVINNFVAALSRRLDFRAILIRRLAALSDEDIETLVMETAGREIRAIVWFGAGIGLVVGVVQTLLNFV
jgi:uncharacterized membrane protein YheB (UPF0754 family)